MIELIINTIIPIIISSHCLAIGIIILLRIKKLNDKKEGILFFSLALAAASWTFSPIIYPYSLKYGWLCAVFLTNMAINYTLLITYKKLIKIFSPIYFIFSLYLIYLIITSNVMSHNFVTKFSIIIFPLSLNINIIIYLYYIKHKTKFHLSLAIMNTIMIAGGLYIALRDTSHWPKIPADSLGTLGFILVIGYHLLHKGYLNNYGWSDYIQQLEHKEKLLNERYLIQKKTNLDSIIVLSQTIEAKDPYTRGHCLRVRDFCNNLGNKLNFDKEKLLFLEIGALLHDIGKIGISGAILNKNGKLTDEEFTIIKKHPDIGADIIKNVDFYKPIIPLVRHHHEFYNGKGYPDGIKGKNIPIEARVMAVADTYDAMTSDRSYRRAFSREKALAILKKIAGTQLDPVIVELFINQEIYLIEHFEDQQLSFEF